MYYFVLILFHSREKWTKKRKKRRNATCISSFLTIKWTATAPVWWDCGPNVLISNPWCLNFSSGEKDFWNAPIDFFSSIYVLTNVWISMYYQLML